MANVARRVIRRAKQRNASPRELKALTEAGLVESNMRNIRGGDRDSTGVLQQRPSQGWGGPSDTVETDVDQFLNAAKRINRSGFHGSAGQLAQAVQRSAFPSRYDERSGQASRLLAKFGGIQDNSLQHGTGASYVSKTTPGVDRSGDRQALLLNYLNSGQRYEDTGLLQLKQGLDGAQDTPSTTTRVRAPIGIGPSGDPVSALKQEAQRINDAQVPYQWGGGHGGRQERGSKVTPVDCSGAVSRVLGINPRVSGQFEKWGKPGRGRVTIYANSHHVLMEIDGHFFGTSAANPGGGAGWIPKSQISASYLKGFTARHSDRLG